MRTMTTKPPKKREDRGDTLIEVLCTIVILGSAIAALLTGLGTTVLSSARHRDQATGNALLRSYAEAVKQSTRAGYINCATSYNVAATAYTLPGGWDPPTNQVVTPPGCPGGTDPGTQRVTITIVTPRNVAQSLDIVVRKS